MRLASHHLHVDSVDYSELQRRSEDIRQQGLGLIAVSYDSVETLKKFADSRKITFPLISDPGSTIIWRFGLLNEGADPRSRTYGIPHPGTFIVDRQGVVVSRFFEDAYQERYTTSAMLGGFGSASAFKAAGPSDRLPSLNDLSLQAA